MELLPLFIIIFVLFLLVLGCITAVVLVIANHSDYNLMPYYITGVPMGYHKAEQENNNARTE